MRTRQALATPAWGTGVIIALNVGMFLVIGPAEDYRLDPQANRDLPSIGRLLADGFRHRGVVALAIAVAFLAPVGWRVERLIGDVGLASTYLVGGFLGGFVEVLRSSGDLAVVGGTAGTATLLGAWTYAHWRLQRTLVAPALVLPAWLWAQAVLAPANTPWVGIIAAGALGVYVVRGTETQS